MSLIKLNSLEWLALGLVCFVSACSPPGAPGWAPGAGAVASGSQEIVEQTPVSNSTQARPTAVADTMPAPAGEQATTKAVASATPTPGRANASAPAQTSPPETPMPGVAAHSEEDMPAEEAMPSKEDGLDKPATQPGPSEEQHMLLVSLQSRGPAPELFNEVWLNSEPFQLADLHGKVVLVEFWTFGCINCIHVIPSLREWHNTYQDDGLVIIGVHTPEFDYEKDLDNVREALVRLDVPYAVAMDNDWKTWRAYRNRYWPAMYLLDKAGNIRYIHIGEGDYDRTEEVIQALLVEE